MSWVVVFIPLLLFGIGLWMYISNFWIRAVIVVWLLAGSLGLAVLLTYVFKRGEGDTALLGAGGGAVAVVAVIACLEIFWKGLHRRHGDPKRWHPWLALALGSLIGASATPVVIAFIGVVSSGVDAVNSHVSSYTGGG